MKRIFLVVYSIAFWLYVYLPLNVPAQYHIDTWTTENGLPQNSVNQAVQTRDGYIWLATNDGLVRFDGVRFKVFNKANSPGISTNRISQVLEDRSGRLWVGNDQGGLAFYKNGTFTVVIKSDETQYSGRNNLVDDGVGGIIFSVSKKGVYQYRDDQIIPLEIPGLHSDANPIYTDRQGGWWFVTPSNFVCWKDNNLRLLKFPEKQMTTAAIYEDRFGNFWAVTGNSNIYRIRGNEMQQFKFSAGVGFNFSEDRDGNLWIATYVNGVLRLDADKINADKLDADDFERLTVENGLMTNNCGVVTADRENGVWLSTQIGLQRLLPQTVHVFSKKDGLAEDNVYPILQDRKGEIWLGAWNQSLIKYESGDFTTFLSDPQIAFYSSLFEDRDGKLWFGNLEGVYYLDNVRPIKFTDKTGFMSPTIFSVISQDRDGGMWFGTDHGLSRYQNGQSKVFTITEGLPDNFVVAFLETKDGKIWIGTRGGIARLENNKITAFTEKDGLSSNYIRSLYEDTDGTLWIGSYDGGLTRYKDGKFTRYTIENGLHSNGVFCILEDDTGWFWMNSNQGIYRVRKQDLNDFADGKTNFLTSITYNTQDGLLTIEGNGGRQPSGLKAHDGHLWFPTARGVAVINPKKVANNPLPPNVLIEEVLIDRKLISNDIFQIAISNPKAAVILNPGQENLEINYTGLSFINSEEIKFKYKLDGLENSWIEAGKRRTAYYSYLPPGEYTFNVIAANRDGVWNTEGKSIKIIVYPPFYRTWWFIVLCAVAIALIIRGIYGYRIAQLRKVNEAQENFSRQLIESQEQERKRIAVELHDSIGQSLIVIRNRALMGLSTPDKTARLIVQMEEISDSAADSITEVRRISHNLHPYQLEHLGLKTAIETMIETADNTSSIEFEKEINEIDDLLTKEAEINLYRIVQESLNNILKHSEATRVTISIRKTGDLLSVLIKDNGKGFNIENLFRSSGGLGLTGIRERAKMLGARQEITSIPNEGTTVSLEISLSSKL